MEQGMNHPASESCILCSGKDFKILFDGEFRVLLCKACCLMFIGASAETDLAGYYEAGYYFGVKKNRVNRSSTRRRVEWLSRHLGGWNHKQVLEIGCGQGHFLKAIQNQGARVHGVEPSVPDAILAGSLSGQDNISIGMLSDFQTNDHYDAVVLIHVFEHMSDPLVALQHIRTLLKPDGLLFIEVPNFFTTTGFFRNRKGIHVCPSPNHRFIYTPRTLRGLLQKAGFNTLFTSFTFHNMRMVFSPSQNRATCVGFEDESYNRVWRFFVLTRFVTGVENKIFKLLGVFKHRKNRPVDTR